jgi:hypothetical protein
VRRGGSRCGYRSTRVRRPFVLFTIAMPIRGEQAPSPTEAARVFIKLIGGAAVARPLGMRVTIPNLIWLHQITTWALASVFL